MEEILYITTLTAAEATYELDPCDRLEDWWDSVFECPSVTESGAKSYDKNTTLFLKRPKIACFKCRKEKTV